MRQTSPRDGYKTSVYSLENQENNLRDNKIISLLLLIVIRYVKNKA